MTLQEIVTAVHGAFGSRFQVTQAMVLQYLDTIQKVAFNRDLDAFLWKEDYLTIYQDVTLSASGFTPWVALDVGKVLTDGAAVGTIISFNNAKRTAQVSTSDTFTGAVTTVGGAGLGTFDSQAVSKGPYSWAGLAPSFGSLTAYTADGGVRRMLGVTRATDLQLHVPGWYGRNTDYNFPAGEYSDRAYLENVRKFDMQRALFFVDTPEETENTYRWVYYMRPPTIGLVDDDANVLIPPEYHQTVLVEGAQVLADRSTYGDRTPEQVLEQVLEPFWYAMMQAYTPDGDNNMTSEGSL